MADAVAGLTEMARVTRPGGLVAACVWDHGGGRGRCPRSGGRRTTSIRTRPASPIVAGTREGQLAELFAAAGLRDIQSSELAVTVAYPTFEDWWEPLTLGVGAAGSYMAGLDDDGRRRSGPLRRAASVAAVRDHGRRVVGSGCGGLTPAAGSYVLDARLLVIRRRHRSGDGES